MKSDQPARIRTAFNIVSSLYSTTANTNTLLNMGKTEAACKTQSDARGVMVANTGQEGEPVKHSLMPGV